ncbi:MAG TPA: glycosyl hydrolase family 18 protein [Gaiellaceae bacterium]|nr:glycosyl hydrolase family 18 protein [Gaiellaceae bacterium]
MRALRLAASAVIAGGVCVAAAPLAAAGVQSCAPAPQHLRFVATPHRPSGVVTWRAPRAMPTGAGGYRVFRNGRVVGQTPLRVRRIRVSFRPGRILKLQVRVALRTGRLWRCGTVLALKPPWHAPGRPGDLVATADPDSATLTWLPSARGDGTLDGYRIFVDGRVARQVRTTSATLSLTPLHSHTVAVAAVDTQGAESALSNAVEVTPTHAAPTTPGTPTAEAVGPSSIRIVWPAAVGSGGARVSYRVLRGGRVVGQTAATAYVVGNLAPATTYSFTVVAVDSLGYASSESAGAQATTMSPAQTSGAVHAFVLASTDESFADLQAHYQEVGTIYPTYFDCLANGTFVGQDNPLITSWSKLRGIRVEARFNCQSTSTLDALLRSPDARAAVIAQMVSEANASGWDGINVDFEAGAAADRPYMTEFVTEAAAALHGDGKTLSVDVSAKVRDVPNHPRSTFYDYDAIAAQADTVFVMCWGIHWSTSVPGAIDDWDWVSQVAAYVAARPNRDKYVIGFGMYGLDWPSGGGPAHPATALEWGDVQKLLSQTGQQVTYDETEHAPHFSYVDGGGLTHDVWFTDAQSLGERIALAHATGVGIGLWRLGDEDPGIWNDPLLAPGAW